MMNRILALILSLILLTLCGCTQHPGIDGSTPANSSSSLTDPPTDPPTNPTATNPTTEATVPTTVPVDENIEFFTKLFDFFDRDHPYGINHYNMAMCCEFSRPEELPLNLFFYNGLTYYDDVLTEEERALMSDWYWLGPHRLVPEEMNEVLQTYFDITLDDIVWDKGEDGLVYWEETGYYYTASNDMLYCEDYVIYAVEELDNGIFKICYTTRYEGDFVITLQSRESEGGEGFRILSNLPA